MPLNFEMVSNHAPFYPFGIDADIVYEITISDTNKLLNATELRNWNFGLKNICLDYDTVSDMALSRHIADSYALDTYYLYNYITHFKTVDRGRHSNVECFYLAQNYFKHPRETIRENTNFICLFP